MALFIKLPIKGLLEGYFSISSKANDIFRISSFLRNGNNNTTTYTSYLRNSLNEEGSSSDKGKGKAIADPNEIQLLRDNQLLEQDINNNIEQKNIRQQNIQYLHQLSKQQQLNPNQHQILLQLIAQNERHTVYIDNQKIQYYLRLREQHSITPQQSQELQDLLHIQQQRQEYSRLNQEHIRRKHLQQMHLNQEANKLNELRNKLAKSNEAVQINTLDYNEAVKAIDTVSKLESTFSKYNLGNNYSLLERNNPSLRKIKEAYPTFFDEDSGNSYKEGLIEVKEYISSEIEANNRTVKKLEASIA